MTHHGMDVKVEHVSKRYEGIAAIEPVHVLEDICFDIQAGDSLAITGPSGSGKSTLLNIMGALDQPTSGKIYLHNQDLSILDVNSLAQIRNQKIGFIFQFHHLLPQCTILENVLIPTLVSKKRAAAVERGHRLLKRVGLARRMHYRPGFLSGGEQQRVAVVRALINQPLILLADEPTGSLDQRSAQDLGKLLVELNQEYKMTLVVVTHSTMIAGFMKNQYVLKDKHLMPA